MIQIDCSCVFRRKFSSVPFLRIFNRSSSMMRNRARRATNESSADAALVPTLLVGQLEYERCLLLLQVSSITNQAVAYRDRNLFTVIFSRKFIQVIGVG